MKRQWLALLADFLIENKIIHIVTSPGSRNAPLLLHLTKHKGLCIYSHVDERSAAFMALGMAQYLKSTVALLCTSGSAPLNFGPALSEAYYQHIPILVLTADRSPEWIDQGDGQTIHQHDVFHAYIRKSFTLPIEINHQDDEWFIWRSLSEAILTTQFPIPGPVHVNIPFREPLYEIEETTYQKPKIISIIPSVMSLADSGWNELSPILTKSKRIMILIGLSASCELTYELLKTLNRLEHVIILTDINSNQSDNSFIRASDDIISMLKENDQDQFKPDLLITFGGSFISKVLKIWLRNNHPREHWHINTAYEAPDTFQCLTKIITSDINLFLNGLNKRITKIDSHFAYQWNMLVSNINRRRDTFLEQAEFSDFKASWILCHFIPKNSIIHLANSMPVRYAHFLDWPSDIQIYSNRGVSGIEGCVSTAVGAAAQFHGYISLITGDLAMIYDSHALWNSNFPGNLRILVLNNGGGGIFRIIDGPGKFPEKRDFFETPHHFNLENLAAMYHLLYRVARNEKELEEALVTLYTGQNQSVILEIFTDQDKNAKVYRTYFEYINSKID